MKCSELSLLSHWQQRKTPSGDKTIVSSDPILEEKGLKMKRNKCEKRIGNENFHWAPQHFILRQQ